MRELARRTGQVGRLAAPEEPDLDVAIALSTSKKVSASWMGPEPTTRRNRETEGRCKEHRSDRGQREFGVCAEASVLDHPESGQNGRRRSCLENRGVSSLPPGYGRHRLRAGSGAEMAGSRPGRDVEKNLWFGDLEPAPLREACA